MASTQQDPGAAAAASGSSQALRVAHLERARRLAEGPGQPRTERPRSRVLSGLSGTVDKVALRVMHRVFAGAHRKTVKNTRGGVQSISDGWQQVAGDGYDPAQFYPRPDAPDVSRRVKTHLGDGRLETLRFESAYAPERSTAQALARRYPANTTCHAMAYRHRRGGRPAVICLHGWAGGNFFFDGQLFRASWLYEKLGLDVYLYVHPYHGPRAPSGTVNGASLHPSTNVTRANEAFLQTAWEVRALAAHHVATGGSEVVGVMGMSLGGFGSALVASVADELSFAVPIMPFADLPAFLWAQGEGTPERQRAEKAGVTFEQFCAAMAVTSPLAMSLKLPPESALIIAGRGDQIIPPAHSEALHAHWGGASMHWFPGGHLVHFGRAGYLKRVAKFLAGLGII